MDFMGFPIIRRSLEHQRYDSPVVMVGKDSWVYLDDAGWFDDMYYGCVCTRVYINMVMWSPGKRRWIFV